MTIPPPRKPSEEGEDYVIVPPDGGWGWVVVLAAFYCQMVIDGIQLSFGMILIEIAESYGVQYSSVSLIGSTMYGMHFLSGPICAGLSYTFGERPVCIFGSVLTFAGMASTYFKPPIYALYITVGFMGGMGLCFVNMNSIIITTLYFSQRRIFALGIVVCGTGAGTMVFSVAANVILKTMDWQTVCLMEALLVLSMALASATFRPLQPTLIKTEASLESIVVKEEEDLDDDNNKRHLPRRTIYYISKPDFLTPRPSREGSVSSTQSVSSFKEYTGQALEDLATAVTHSHVTRGQHQCQKLNRYCCPCLPKHRRRHQVISMNPNLKNLVLQEDVEHGVRRISVEDDEVPEEGGGCRALCVRILSAMIDWRILSSWYFLIYCFGGALSASALIIVVFYEKVRVLAQGASEDEAMWYMVGLGGANMAWRLVLGMISMAPRVNYHSLNIAGLLLGGIATIASGLSKSVYYGYFCGAMYGLAIACFAVFYPVILLELVGMDKISNATGITMLFMGVFSVLGAPVSGWVMEKMKDNDTPFYIAGLMFTLSGIMFVFITGKHRKHRPHHRS